MTMLMTNPHSPAAAEFLVMMISGLKKSASRYSLTFSKFFGLILLVSMFSLSPSSHRMYCLMSPIKIFFAAPHPDPSPPFKSVGLPFLSHLMAGTIPPNRHMVDSNTSDTPGGGVPMDLAAEMSFGSSPASAAMAASTAGSALARSAAVSAANAATSTWTLVTSTLSISALAVSSSTIAFSRPTTSAIPSAVAALPVASSTMMAKSILSCATASPVSLSLRRPESRLEMAVSAVSRLSPSMRLYSFRNSKYDLGVVYLRREVG